MREGVEIVAMSPPTPGNSNYGASGPSDDLAVKPWFSSTTTKTWSKRGVTAVPVGDGLGVGVGLGASALTVVGRSEGGQPGDPFASGTDIDHVREPLAPGLVSSRSATSCRLPPTSQASVMPTGDESTIAVELELMPRQPTSMVPAWVVVTPGTAAVVAAGPLHLTARRRVASRGSTPV